MEGNHHRGLDGFAKESKHCHSPRGLAELGLNRKGLMGLRQLLKGLDPFLISCAEEECMRLVRFYRGSKCKMGHLLKRAKGAKDLYMSHLRPFLLKHQAILDQIVDFIYNQLSKFVSAHQAKIQFAKTISLEILTSAYQFVRGMMHPMQKQPNPNAAIEGPPRRIEELEFDKED
ncbi:hypothetical protein SO802_028354 [Lithocarpus litseifolius]|uniref:Uncharacterized protein n=1 Tax=Lithocarpus litseifolius TaxID=425828 RepID=A0AAW2BQ34_9ROSI